MRDGQAEMADLILKDIDPVLNERLLRLGLARRWNSRDTVVRVLEAGLDAFEHEMRAELVSAAATAQPAPTASAPAANKEHDLFAEALNALQDVPPGAF